MFSTICSNFAHVLSLKNGQEDQEEIIAFGLEIIFSELAKLIILLSVGLVINRLLEVIVITFIFSCYRMLSGGIHLKSFSSCLFATLTSIILLALVIETLAVKLSIEMIALLVFLTHLFNMFLVIFRVPVGNKNHAITSNEKIRFFKRASFLFITFITLTTLFFLVFWNTHLIKVIAISAAAGINLQALTLMPFTHRLVDF